MNKTEKLIKALARAGMDEFKAVTLTENRQGLMVKHDYIGPIPSKDALEKCEQARNIADKFGYRSEPRGFKQATLIYLT